MKEQTAFEKWAIAIGVFFGTALLIMLAWNWLFPYLFKLPTMNYWQSLVLYGMCNLMFKNGNKK